MAQLSKDEKEAMRKQLAAVVAAAPDDMRLLEFAVQNVMKIKWAHIRPKGNVIVVGGRNGQGKSSLLQAIGFLLCGAEIVPTDVIRVGEKVATITGQVGPFKITRQFNRRDAEKARGGHLWATRIRLQGPMGEEYQQSSEILGKLLDLLTFDPMAFMRMKAKEQFDALKAMAKFEVDIDTLDAAQAVDYEARREAKYHAEAVTARLEAAGDKTMPLDATLPEPMDTAEFAKRLEAAAGHNAKVERARAEKARWEAQAGLLNAQAAAMRSEAREILDRASLLDGWQATVTIGEHTPANEAAEAMEAASKVVIEAEIDTAEVSAALRAALEGNAALERAKQYRALQAEHTAAWAAHTELNERMKARAAARAAAMQAAEMPIAGLAIGDGEVFYQGVPFNQASGAEQIRVSLAIGMAATRR